MKPLHLIFNQIKVLWQYVQGARNMLVYCVKTFHVEQGKVGEFWPEDENHSLGPRGEKLIAVEAENCINCVFINYSEKYCHNRKPSCTSSKRADGRNISWVLLENTEKIR